MKMLIQLISSIHWFIYLAAGLVLCLYKYLDEHIKYKERIKENPDLMDPAEIKKKMIAMCIIIMVVCIILAIFSYIGESNFDVAWFPFV